MSNHMPLNEKLVRFIEPRVYRDQKGKPLSVAVYATDDMPLSPAETVAIKKNPSQADIDRLRRMVTAANAHDAMLQALKTTAGNIRSIGQAGVLGPVYESYRPWLEVVEAAIAKAEGDE